MDGLSAAQSGEKLFARDDWPHRLGPFEALGQRYEVWTDDGALARLLSSLYAPMASPHGTEAAVYRVVTPRVGSKGTVLRNDLVIGERHSAAGVLELLQWAINRQVIEGSCVDRILLHAGAVSRDGVAVVLPAAMESGKTTLTTGLLDRGCEYLTDEAAAVDRDLTVTGYPKPLSIDPGAWEVLTHHRPHLEPALDGYLDRQWLVPVVPIAAVAGRARLGAVVLPRYEAQAPTRVERLSGAAALTALAHCTFVPEDATMPVGHVGQLSAIVHAVPVHRMVSGDLAEACAAVLDVLDGTLSTATS